VRARSRKALAPAETVITGCDAMASRSADTSPVSSAPAMDAADPAGGEHPHAGAAAIATDADTVVAPNSHRCPTATATSRSAALRASPRMRSCSSSLNPTRTTPSRIAVTAGTAPRGPDRRRAPFEGLTVGRRGQAEMREDRRLQRHHGATGGHGIGDLAEQTASITAPGYGRRKRRSERRDQNVPTKAPSGLPSLTTPGNASIVIAKALTGPSMLKVSISGFGPKMPSEITWPSSTTPHSW
jgi:hypothetical protein